MLDLVIENGLVVNGKNEPAFRADVGISGDRIAKIGSLAGVPAARRIDAAGKWVTPGFIDPHCHSDALILHQGKNPLRLRQGITTEIIGNCGISAAPVNAQRLDLLRRYCAPMFGGIDLPYSWRSFGDYLDVVEQARPVLNVGALVGHGALRVAVMGFDNRAPSPAEMEEMKALLRQSLEAGAMGMSSGLVYPPGAYSTPDELVELAGVLKEFDALYTTHMRSETLKLVESVEETLALTRRTGVNTQISHHKASGIKNKGKSTITLELIAKARAQGLPVACDVYPYTAASTQFSTILPPWAMEGGVDKMIQRLQDPAQRAKIREVMLDEQADFENVSQNTTWDKIIISECALRQYEGKSVAQIAREAGADVYDKAFEILIESHNRAMMILYLMDEDDVSAILASPFAMVASDGIPSLGSCHPRYLGSFARVLDYYVRQRHLLTLEEAIHKMTGMTAAKFGLEGRGLVEEGCYADLVVLDLENFRDNATYDRFDAVADGICQVVINGQIGVDQGQYLGLCCGRVLR